MIISCPEKYYLVDVMLCSLTQVSALWKNIMPPFYGLKNNQIPKVETVCPSKTSTNFYQTARYHLSPLQEFQISHLTLSLALLLYDQLQVGHGLIFQIFRPPGLSKGLVRFSSDYITLCFSLDLGMVLLLIPSA
jgi:hypothetical protein